MKRSSSCKVKRWASATKSRTHTMRAWAQRKYGGREVLFLSRDCAIPSVRHPEHVLVEVHAASLNPIDLLMRGGYGRTILNILRRTQCTQQNAPEFPLVLGRDFSGVVCSTGHSVQNFKPGDEVWGTTDLSGTGGHAEFTVVLADHISMKPESLSHTEAASIPYVAMTTWAALCTVGGLTQSHALGKRVLVNGGSGGVGTFAIQLLDAWGAHVTATCSAGAVDLVTSLGVDQVVDYTTQNVNKELGKMERFDFILDAVGSADHLTQFLSKYTNATFVTVVNPLLRNADDGLVGGGIKSAINLAPRVIQALRYGQHYRWAFFCPNGGAMQRVANMADQFQIQPVIEKVYNFENLPDAYDRLEAKHARGKLVIDIIGREGSDVDTERHSLPHDHPT